MSTSSRSTVRVRPCAETRAICSGVSFGNAGSLPGGNVRGAGEVPIESLLELMARSDDPDILLSGHDRPSWLRSSYFRLFAAQDKAGRVCPGDLFAVLVG